MDLRNYLPSDLVLDLDLFQRSILQNGQNWPWAAGRQSSSEVCSDPALLSDAEYPEILQNGFSILPNPPALRTCTSARSPVITQGGTTAMLFSTPLISAASAILLGTAAATPTKDWKYELGWEGVTLNSTDIGTPVHKREVEKRTTDGVYICADINWGPPCGYAKQTLGECIVLGSDWADKISSFGPDPGQTCVAYNINLCEIGDGIITWNFKYPGNSTGGLGTNNVWNDLIRAWECFPPEDVGI